MTEQQMLTDQWNFYKELYLPTEEALTRQAMAGIPVDYEQALISRDLARTFKKQQAIAEREMQRYGVAPTTERPVDRTTELIRRSAEIGARNLARSNARDIELARMSSLAKIGQGIPEQAIYGTATAQGMQSAIKAKKAAAKSSMVNLGLSTLGTLAGVFGGGTSSPSAWGSLKGLMSPSQPSTALPQYSPLTSTTNLTSREAGTQTYSWLP